MQKFEKLLAENGELTVRNAALKASVARLEHQLTDCESALVEEKITSQEKKHQAERCQFQIAELQAEINGLRIKYANLVQETEKTREGKQTAVEKVKQELQGRAEELRAYPELLRAAEQRLLERQESLQGLERRCSEKSESVKQLQSKMESQTKQLRASVEMKESIHEANLQLEEHIQLLQRKADVLQLENLELVRKVAAHEEALRYSNRQLDQRSSECQALSRQLEAALSDVREQVRKVQLQAASREEALQTKILELEAEKSRRDNEFKLLRQKKISAEKQFEVRLKDLQLSLDQSESHKRSIQNYVDFLKNSYKTMFDEGLQMSTFGSSYFLK
uniref:Outer dense fiber of sperm tails 2-like n=1 Tax=Iconisemion striatum TaxID=60296 RepID=A0A1A7X4F6_9TELE